MNTNSFLHLLLCCFSLPAMSFYMSPLAVSLPVCCIFKVFYIEFTNPPGSFFQIVFFCVVTWIMAQLQSPGLGYYLLCTSYFLFIFHIATSSFFNTQGAGTFLKIKLMMLRLDTSQNVEKMWVKICNLNHIPKIGGSESRSCGRRDLFWNFPFDVCLCERRFFHLLSGHYSVPRTFLLPREGNTPCLIHSAVCLFLANSCPLRIHQIESPQLFFFSAISDVPQLSAACGFFQWPWEFVILLCEWNMVLWY